MFQISSRALSSAVIAASLAPSVGFAQCTPTWSERGIAGPPPREGALMAFDADREVVVLFGGTGNGGVRFDDTWEWNGESWTEIKADAGPVARGWGGAAFDSRRGRVVIFGGNAVSNSTNLGDTWEWDGETWTEWTLSGPSIRCCIGMTFDEARGRSVLFGGANLSTSYRQTWERLGVSWSLASSTGPSVRYAPGLAFDSTRERVVFFGGSVIHGNTQRFNDTWEWDGAAWTEIMPTTRPPVRRFHAMAFDPVRDRTVIFGGDSTNNLFLADTWLWNGSEWTEFVSAGPAPRRTPTMVYDDVRGELVLFGGLTTTVQGDTWVLASPFGISRQPTPQQVCPSDTAVFSIRVARGGGSVPEISWEYQLADDPGTWVDVVEGENLDAKGSALFECDGSQAHTLSVRARRDFSRTDWILLRAFASNTCGSATSAEASLVICPPDFNCDGVPNSQDFFDFLAAFFALDPNADFNRDTLLNSQDFFDFLTAFFAGCD